MMNGGLKTYKEKYYIYIKIRDHICIFNFKLSNNII